MSLTPSRRVSPWRWLSIFILLACLGTAGVTLPIVYNLNQQLRAEQLGEARQRWRTNGPRDYDLSYTVTYDRNRLGERHIVIVRGGEVVFASCEGEVVTVSPALAAACGLSMAAMNQAQARDIPALFAHIEELVKMKEEAPSRTFLVVVFDPFKGHPRRIVHRVRGTDTRESWDLLLWPPGALESLETMAKAGKEIKR